MAQHLREDHAAGELIAPFNVRSCERGKQGHRGAQKRTAQFLAITFNFTLNYADFCIKSH